MTKVKKIRAKLGIFFMLAAIMTLTTTYAAASTDSTYLKVTNDSKTTSVVGPSPCAKFSIKILQNNGAYEAMLKDPWLWHTRKSDSNLKKGTSVSFKRTDGSSGAYWKGWIKNGSISITATKK